MLEEVSRLLREEKKGWRSPTARASAGPDGAITGSTTAGAGWGHEEGARARLKAGAAGEVGETGRGLGFSRRGRN